MRAVVITAPSVAELAEVEAPEAGEGDVVVDVLLTGICGTDLHILDGHYPTARYPLVPGHEAVGAVASVGSGVAGLQVGDRVVIDPGLPCRACRDCLRDRPNLCADRRAIGASRPGAAAAQVAVPAVNCHVVHDTVPDHVAVLAEPLACAVHAFDLVPDTAGADIAVYGAGTIGTLCAQVARHVGAGSVTVIDSSPERAHAALARGADSAVHEAADAGADRRWDVVLDATGAPAAVQDGLARVARGGTFVQVGVVPSDAVVTLSPYDVYLREIRIQGSMTTRFTFPRALELLASGAVETSGMTSEPFALADYSLAIKAARSGEYLKVVVDPRR